jgi:ribosomal protein S4
MEASKRGQAPNWIAVDRDTFAGRMLELPQRAAIPVPAQEQLVVELYSK